MAVPLPTDGNNINPATRINVDTAVVICSFDDFLINLPQKTNDINRKTKIVSKFHELMMFK